MAVKIICDLCGKETSDNNKYIIPTFACELNPPYFEASFSTSPRILNLCVECKKRIALEVNSIICSKSHKS